MLHLRDWQVINPVLESSGELSLVRILTNKVTCADA